MQTDIHTDTHTHETTTVTLAAHAHRGLIIITIITTSMKALKCKPSAQFAYNYTINVLSKCGNIISHRSSVFEVDTTAIDLRRSAHRSSIFEGRHIYHRSSKVDTSIVDLRKSTSIFEGRHIDICHRILRQRRSIVIPKILRGTHNIKRRYTRPYTYIRTYGNSPTRALIMYYTPICIAYCTSRRGN